MVGPRNKAQGCAPKVRLAEATPEEKVVSVTGAAVAPGEARRGARRRTVARRSERGLRGEDDMADHWIRMTGWRIQGLR